MNRPCPSREELQQLATGMLPEPPATEVESHVLECPACQATTASLKLGDTFVDEVRQGARQAQHASGQLAAEDQARVERLIADLSGLHQASGGDTDVVSQQPPPTGVAPAAKGDLLAELSAYWQPPQRADELGRLGGYRVLRLLGAGGMGGVFLAEDPQLKRQVAICTGV
jgi:anti-sigma factor RsiW